LSPWPKGSEFGRVENPDCVVDKSDWLGQGKKGRWRLKSTRRANDISP